MYMYSSTSYVLDSFLTKKEKGLLGGLYCGNTIPSFSSVIINGLHANHNGDQTNDYWPSWRSVSVTAG